MNFDRNTVLGFIILALLFFCYFYFTSKEQAALRKNKAGQDSVVNANRPEPDTSSVKNVTVAADSGNITANHGLFSNADTAENLVFAENNLIKIAFTTKGGQPKWVELKKFKNQDSGLVKLAASAFNSISYTVNTSANKSMPVTELIFPEYQKSGNVNGDTVISFSTRSSDSSSVITHRFVLKPGEYMIDFNVELTGADKLLTGGKLNLTWQYEAEQLESDISFEKQNSQIGYVMNEEYDYHTITRRSSKDFDQPVKWIGIRQRFFNTILVAKDKFAGGKMEWNIPPDNQHKIVAVTANMQVNVPASSPAAIPFSIFYGPSAYPVLKKYNLKFDKLVNLGQGPYAFVRPVNRFLVMPIFDFLLTFLKSYGLVIAFLTIIIRLLISPLTYSSYLSGAKMKVLRPEIAALRAKYGNDQQQMSMEQMKLFREAGVNPLGGCIPALLQIPIFFALYSFFSSNVSLRGQGFFWADDLSAYDVIINFGVRIPLLGSHLSLFTITAVVTSFFISIYSMSISPDQSNPVLKYMPYIFPVFLLFIFNNLPSALTWYYTVSNLITLALQFVILNYIIDHDKILAKIEQTRKMPKRKSKWQERFEQVQEQQKKQKESRQQTRR